MESITLDCSEDNIKNKNHEMNPNICLLYTSKTVSEEAIQRTLQWCNNLPRKLLNYRTPLEVFLEEVELD